MTDKQNAFDESDVSWQKPEAVKPELPPVITPDIPTAWLSFWTYIRMPLGALMWFITGWNLFSLPVPLAGGVLGVISLGVALAIGAIAVGLHRRELWAWKANMVIIFIDPVFMMLRGFQPQENAASLIGFLIGQAIVGWGIWSLPNYIYFMKRKELFK